MREALLSIGKMAALNRMSVSTLRLYDEAGALLLEREGTVPRPL